LDLFQGVDRPRVRGKKAVCSAEFETAWKQYGRKEEKANAYAAWKAVAPSVGGEVALLGVVLAALKWQGPLFAKEGWKFAKYFERYLKRRKWEDEPGPAAPNVPHETRCDFHQRSPNFASKYPRAGCDRCQHFAARNGTRSSEPTRAADAMPAWATAPPPKEWTAEERAEAAKLTAKRNGAQPKEVPHADR
jgi:hypothetical protein